MPRTGRPTKINDVVGLRPVLDAEGQPTDATEPMTVADKIVEHLERGSYMEQAAAAAGINKTTLYDWLRGGAHAISKHSQGSRLRAEERRLMDFSHAVEVAQAIAEVNGLARIDALANGPDAAVALRAEQWRMERRFSKRWGQKGSLEVTGADGGALTIDLADTARSLITDQLDRIAGTLDSLAGPAPEPPPAVTAGPEDGELPPEV
jgi:transposase-like protein